MQASSKVNHGDKVLAAGSASCATRQASGLHNRDWLLDNVPDYSDARRKNRPYKFEKYQACHGDRLQGGDGHL